MTLNRCQNSYLYTILLFLQSTLYFAISTFNILCATLNFSYSLKSSFDFNYLYFSFKFTYLTTYQNIAKRLFCQPRTQGLIAASVGGRAGSGDKTLGTRFRHSSFSILNPTAILSRTDIVGSGLTHSLPQRTPK